MTEPKQLPDEFYDLVDRFLEVADDLHQAWPGSRVTHTLMYAAARFSADQWLQRHGDDGSGPDDMQADAATDKSEADIAAAVNAAADRAAAQYREMFIDNLIDLRSAD